jgi:hypothetical protein
MPQTAIIDRHFDFGNDAAGAHEIVVFDSVLSEAHDFEIAIVDDPVETGVSLSDHAYRKPRKLQMEVAVSDTPLLSDGKGTPSAQLATTWTNGGSVRRSVVAWNYIVDKANTFAIFDVQTGLELYQNMMFEAGSASTTKDTAGCLRATIKLKQITFATTQMVAYPPRGPKKTQRAGAESTEEGRKESEETTNKKPVSILKGQVPGPWNDWGRKK